MLSFLFPVTSVAQQQDDSTEFPSVFTAVETRPAKMVNKFLKMIASEKYVKAQEFKADIFEKSLEAKKENPKIKNTYMDAMYPLWEIGNAILLYKQAPNDKYGVMVYDPAKAYDIFSKVMRAGKYCEEAKSYFTNPENDVEDIKLDAVQWEIETILVDKAKTKNYVDAYGELYNKLLDDSKYKSAVYDMYEYLFYDKIVKKPTLADYNKFLQSFPKSKHIANVTVWRDSLHIEEMEQTVKSCDDFLSTYPNSKFIGKVQKMREACAATEVETNGGLSDCKAFFDRYPNSDYKQRIQDRVLALMVAPEVSLKDFNDYETTFGSFKDDRVVNAFEQLRNLETHWAHLGYVKPIKKVTTKTTAKGDGYETIYSFNENGLMTSAVNQKLMTSDIYEYEFVKNVGWHIKSCQHKMPGNDMLMTYNYDENNHLTSKVSSNGAMLEYESSLNDYTEKEYTSRHRLQTTRTYDFFGRLLRTDNMDGTYTTYSYNSQGLLEKETKFNGYNAIGTYTFSYTNNSEGDWTRRDKMKGNAVVQTIIRTIEYAE